MNTLRDALVITGAGIAGLGFFGWPVLRARRARAWPTAAGKVLESMIVEDNSSDSDSRSDKVQVLYRYQVAGRDYESTRIGFWDLFTGHSRRGGAQAQLKAYTPGTAVTVHYDPKNPSEAVIETEVAWSSYFAVALFALFVAGGVSTIVRILRA